MKKNLLAIAVWMIAGPTAAVKTLEIARDLEDRRMRRHVKQPRFTAEEHRIATSAIDKTFSR